MMSRVAAISSHSYVLGPSAISRQCTVLSLVISQVIYSTAPCFQAHVRATQSHTRARANLILIVLYVSYIVYAFRV
jgi:hypothetical protein